MPRLRYRRPMQERLPLSELPYWQLVALADQGEITAAEVRDAIAEAARARNGGMDPYEHLRDPDAWPDGRRR